MILEHKTQYTSDTKLETIREGAKANLLLRMMFCLLSQIPVEQYIFTLIPDIDLNHGYQTRTSLINVQQPLALLIGSSKV